MNAVSVVIITRNEESNIVACIRSAQQLTDDIVVVDCGSDDGTVAMAKAEGARVFDVEWQGFGHSRNLGAERARHNWIFALDADERISPELAAAVHHLDLSTATRMFRFRRQNHIASEKIRFGTLGYEKVTRIYNRQVCSWDLSLVHEKLISQQEVSRIMLQGHIEHFGLKSFDDYRNKSVMYAQLSARKYYADDRKVMVLKRYISPIFQPAVVSDHGCHAEAITAFQEAILENIGFHSIEYG